jgi:hypothetical protein
VAVGLERLLRRREDATRHFGGTLRVGLAQQQHELVAAQPRHRVLPAHLALQAARQLDQHRVARAVPERVVDGLEVVEVEEHQRQRRAVAVRAVQRHAAAVLQQRPVRQPGQGVVVRQVLDARLAVLLFAHLLLERTQRVVEGSVRSRTRRSRPACVSRKDRSARLRAVMSIVIQIEPASGLAGSIARLRTSHSISCPSRWRSTISPSKARPCANGA